MSPSPITIVIVHPEVYLVTSFFGTLYGVIGGVVYGCVLKIFSEKL